jgi:16S rRNA (cytidine1402-2'-O)-methyltransferase
MTLASHSNGSETETGQDNSVLLRFKAKKGLVLVPTPLSADLPLDSVSKELLMALTEDFKSGRSRIVVEDLRPARQRWSAIWGLPREVMEHFVALNEHEKNGQMTSDLFSFMKKGGKVFLLSDGGVPGFCDPGGELIFACNESQIPVSSLPLPNSLIQAHALSGLIGNKEFSFLGFPPQETGARGIFWQQALERKHPVMMMDTAYRLPKVADELARSLGQFSHGEWYFFLATDLNRASERCFFGHYVCGKSREPLESLKDLTPAELKRDFVLVISKIAPGLGMKNKK